MINQDFKNIAEILKAFPDEDSCLNHIEELRWNGIVISPFELNSKVYACQKNKFRCKNSGKYFNAKTNTLFHNSKIDLQKWFIAIWLLSTEKRKISTIELSRTLNITQKSAWLMQKNISQYLGNDKTSKEAYKLKKISKKVTEKTAAEIEVIVENDKLQMVEWLKLLKK